MADAKLQITLREENAEREGALLHFEPGTSIQGTVQVTSQDALNCRGVYVRLGWHTEGRGDRDGAKIAENVVVQGPLAASTALSQNFNFSLPREPWSFAGHYVNIIWAIEAVIDIPMAPDVVCQEPFILAPRRL